MIAYWFYYFLDNGDKLGAKPASKLLLADVVIRVVWVRIEIIVGIHVGFCFSKNASVLHLPLSFIRFCKRSASGLGGGRRTASTAI
jgi:hypothetical protein